MSSTLQESLLTALCFDENHVVSILPIVSEGIFEGVYREIASRVLDYRARFKKPPGQSHIDDLFDEIITDPEHKQYDTYNRLIVGMLEQYSNGFNIEYVISRTSEFIRRQQLKEGVTRAAERYQQGGEDIAKDVEAILQETLSQHVKSVDHGVFLGNVDRSLGFLDHQEGDYCRTGIDELDKNHIFPVRKELFAFLAPQKRGKSFFLTHMGKMALLQGWKVAEATLEMSEERKCERYMQALFSVSREKGSQRRAIIDLDALNRLVGFKVESHRAKWAFEDESTRKYIEKRLTNPYWERRFNNLVIKHFPTGAATVRDLELWLDSLEQAEGFIPDMLMVDYPGIMNLGEARHQRLNLGRTIVDLRGLAVKRNMAVIAPSQVNREGAKSKNVRATHTAEDISLISTCDVAITYSQTDQEHKLGLARLYVDRARNDRDRFTVLIGQSYRTGQFVLESVRMTDKYDEYLTAISGQVQDDDNSSDDEEEDDE